MANRYKVTLTKTERAQLTELTRSGKSTAAKFIHARALLLCDAGEWGEPWKVVDVAIDGVSLVTTYRGSFATEVRTNGMDSLIQQLMDKNDKIAIK